MKSFITIIVCFLITACQNRPPQGTTPVKADQQPKTIVAIAHPSDTTKLINNITLNATSTYLLKSDVKANSTGYITKVSIKLADHVNKGIVLFGLQTKEARALGNTIDQLDPSFRFNGATTVISPATGYVAMVNHQVGDYVQDGEILATITDASSFGFIMDAPYEYMPLIKSKRTLSISLPGGEMVTGEIAKIMPSVDPVTQTLKILLKVSGSTIPENLIGTVIIPQTTAYGLSVPKMAILTNETQSNFWVMKLINDSTAVKVNIVKGLETDKYIQIKSGDLTVKDRVIISGNFGLPDTAIVKVQNP